MRMIARVAAFAAPLLIVSGLSLAPALASGDTCDWGSSGSFQQSDLVNSNGVIFQCGITASGPQWMDAGQSTAVGTAVGDYYYGQNPASYSPGTVLQDDFGEAWSNGGSAWTDIGSWDSFAASTGCYDSTGAGCGGYMYFP